jgi:Zn-dependent M28 family amino/carboxypeptidase
MQIVPEPTPEVGFYYRSDHFNLAKQGVPMLYAKAGIDHADGGAERGRAWEADYFANIYHKPNDQYDPAWDASGVMKEIATYYEVGREVANSRDWPQWREGSEFRAIREKSRAAR